MSAPPAAEPDSWHGPSAEAWQWMAAVALGVGTWWGWLARDHAAGAGVGASYSAWQVIGCALTLGVVTATLSRRWRANLVAGGVSLGFWCSWTIWAWTRDNGGLWAVGSAMVAASVVVGTVLVGGVTERLRARRRCRPGREILVVPAGGPGHGRVMARGRVKFYREEKGWGGISCDELPPGQDAWVHFSVIEAPGYRTLEAGEEVDFEYEPAVQDSWRFRATRVRSLRVDQPAPVDPPGPSPDGAYSSTVSITVEQEAPNARRP